MEFLILGIVIVFAFDKLIKIAKGKIEPLLEELEDIKSKLTK